MPSRLILVVLAGALFCGGELAAQTRVRTETIAPPPPPQAATPEPPARPAAIPDPPRVPDSPREAGPPGTAAPKLAVRPVRPDTAGILTPPDIIMDPGKLPAAVARMRVRILEAARSGELNKLLAVMQSSEVMPIFSLGNDKNPTTYWKMSYPDSDGVEILAILIEILEAGFVHVDQGTPQEMYVWPYFARTPLKELTPAQKVELFKIVTGSDYKEMQEFGAYVFYRLGIAPDGTWHFFVAGD